MNLSEAANAIGAKIVGEDLSLQSFCIDSRNIKSGDMFIAIRGQQVDGHDFIEAAIQKGATSVMATRPPLSDLEKKISFLVVENIELALGALAQYYRTKYPIPLVGITGSCGKTSVKGMLGSILSQSAPTLVTQGNRNNQLGMPLTLLELRPEHAYAVIEMGATQKNDIAYLCQIAKPNVTMITLVAPGHLNGFKTIEGVAEGKSEIYESLPEDGIAILNIDEPFHKEWIKIIGKRSYITFSLSNPEAFVRAKNIKLESFGVHFDLLLGSEVYAISLPIPGQHMAMNALAASAAAYALGIVPKHIVKGLAAYTGTERRLALVKGLNGACVIDDSYNANPVSMRAAVEVLSGVKGDKILVIGDMMNLGVDSDRFHTEIGSFAREKGINRIFAIGSSTSFVVKAFGEGGQSYPDKKTLINALKPLLHETSVVLVKGSLSMGMAEISDALIVNKEVSC